MIQELHLLLRNLLDIFAPRPRKWVSSGHTVVHALRIWLASFAAGDVFLAAVVIFRCIGYTYSSLIMMAGIVLLSRSTVCMNVSGISYSKYYIWRSLWDEWRRVWHCPTNWWAFLFVIVAFWTLVGVIIFLTFYSGDCVSSGAHIPQNTYCSKFHHCFGVIELKLLEAVWRQWTEAVLLVYSRS